MKSMMPYGITGLERVNLYTVMSGYIFSLFDSPQFFRASSISMLHLHSQTHYNGYDTSGRVMNPHCDLYLTKPNIPYRQISMPSWDSNPQTQQDNARKPTP